MKFISLVLLLISFNLSAKLVVISDLDETLRIAQTHNYLISLMEIMKGVKPFAQMKTLFNDISTHQDADFYYVSASYYKFYNGQRWVNEQKFPQGKVFQKPKFSTSSYDFKLQTLENLYKQGAFDASDNFLFFGDNSSHDEDVYLEFKKKYALQGDIFIRDIKSKATPFSKYITPETKAGIHYFYTEWQVLQSPLAALMDPATVSEFENVYSKGQGQVHTQRVYLEKLLKEKICGHRRLSHIECTVLVNREMNLVRQTYFAN